MIEQYVPVNDVKFIQIAKHYSGLFEVWEMLSPTVGNPVGRFKTRRDANKVAKQLASTRGLEIVSTHKVI